MGEEKRFEEQVKRWLKEHGAWVLKTWGGGFQRSGIPDLLVCWKGRFVAIELKSSRGRATPLQEFELESIRSSGGFGAVLRPEDFDSFKALMEGMR